MAWIPECKPANFFNSRRVGCQIVFLSCMLYFSQGMGSPGSPQCTIQVLRGRRSSSKMRLFSDSVFGWEGEMRPVIKLNTGSGILCPCTFVGRKWAFSFSLDKVFVWDSDFVFVLCFFLELLLLASFLFFLLVLRGVVSSFLIFFLLLFLVFLCLLSSSSSFLLFCLLFLLSCFYFSGELLLNKRASVTSFLQGIITKYSSNTQVLKTRKWTRLMKPYCYR